jgi:hypothetical protein
MDVIFWETIPISSKILPSQYNASEKRANAPRGLSLNNFCLAPGFLDVPSSSYFLQSTEMTGLSCDVTQTSGSRANQLTLWSDAKWMSVWTQEVFVLPQDGTRL